MKNKFCPINFDCDLMVECNELGFCPNYDECLRDYFWRNQDSESLPYEIFERRVENGAIMNCLLAMSNRYTVYSDSAKEGGWHYPCDLPYYFDPENEGALTVKSPATMWGVFTIPLREVGYERAIDLTPYYCYWAIAKQSSNFREFQEAILNFDAEEDCLIRYCQDIDEGEENMLYELEKHIITVTKELNDGENS